VELSDRYPSVVDRYFTRRYVLKEGRRDVCLLFHSNKICVVTLAKSHALVQDRVPIAKVNFKVTKKVDRSENKVKGKSKKGGQFVEETSLLCIVECVDGTEHHIEACIRGKLVEINENLATNPQLLLDKPETEGYIGIVLQRLGDSDVAHPQHLNQSDYDNL